MKKLFVVFSILVYLLAYLPYGMGAPASIQNAEIAKIETELYGFEYNNEALEERVARLERTIYGKNLNGNLTNRIKKLATDIISEQIGLEIPPSDDTFAEADSALMADNSVNYPVVDEIEKMLFNQTYTNRDFHTRIVTIERKLFGKIYDVDDYSTRMDRIKAEVMPERLAREKVFGYDNSNSLTASDLSGLNANRYSGMYGQENYTRPYVNYGDTTGGASLLPDNIEDELAQLEYNTFGTEFSDEDTKTRIKRLNSVNKAKKTSQKYDSQKYNQRMSTFMEIGAMLLMILAMVL